jgi:hypothetical protein
MKYYLLSLPSTSESEVQNATKLLRPSKSVGIDGIPSFVLRVVLKYLFLFLSLF